MPRVSVIIPTYNRSIVSAAVESVLAQGQADFELIVVDDGSTDRSCAQLGKTFAARREFRLIRIEHRGPAGARNAGAALAASPLLAFLDSDDVWAPNKLERQLRFMQEHPEFQISQTQETWIRDGTRVNPGRRHLKRAGDIFVDSLRTCLVSPSATILGRALFRAAGGFDEDMAAAEDYDLWLRILLRHQAGLLDEPLVMRRAGHRDQLSATVPAIDRFRILALLKLLQDRALSGTRRAAVIEVLAEKCVIYANGLNRRGRLAEAQLHQSIAREAALRWDLGPDTALARAVAELRARLRAQASQTRLAPALEAAAQNADETPSEKPYLEPRR